MSAQRLLRFCLMVSVLCASFVTAGSSPKNGGFEEDAVRGLPPGWQLWGHDASRDARDFAVDDTVSHAGRRSLRIRHPEGANGYIVTAVRDNQIAVQSNCAYEVSFYAKADRDCEISVHVEAQPVKGSPQGARGFFEKRFPVGGEWQRVAFTVTEGWTFFRDEAGYLMVAIHAMPSGVRTPGRTVWIDDVAIDERPLPTGALRLLDPRKLSYEPLQHRLAPGDALDVTVDATRPLRQATRLACGVSFHRASGYMGLPYDREGEYRLAPWQEDAVRALHLPFTRFYAVGDEAYPLEQALDKIVHVLDRCGIPQRDTVLEFETQGATTLLPPETWARGVSYSQKMGYAFRRWEVSNEPWHKPAFPTPDDYVSHLKAVSASVRAVQKEALIGVGIHYADLPWGHAILAAAAGHYDFVCGHWYSFIHATKHPVEAVAGMENYRLLDEMLRMNALIRHYNPGREVRQFDTEWSLHSNAGGTVATTSQNGNIVGALHRAVRLIYYLREDIVEGASAWEMFSSPAKARWNALGLIAPDEAREAAIYWVHRYVNAYVGAYALTVSGTTPYWEPPTQDGEPRPLPAGPLAPLVALSDGSGKPVTVIAANVSGSRGVPCVLRLKGVVVRTADGVCLSQKDEAAHPLLEKTEDMITPFPVRVEEGGAVRCELPPKSVVFLIIQP